MQMNHPELEPQRPTPLPLPKGIDLKELVGDEVYTYIVRTSMFYINRDMDEVYAIRGSNKLFLDTLSKLKRLFYLDKQFVENYERRLDQMMFEFIEVLNFCEL
jgi:hypothetical protein